MQNTFCQEKIIPDTRYMVDKYFCNNGGISYYAHCPSCRGFLREFGPQERSVVCHDCNLTVNLKSSSYHDYFVMLDFPRMIRNLIEEYSDYYLSIMNRERRGGSCYRSFHDGRCFIEFWLSLPDELKKRFATAIFNSDGSPLFKSSRFSVCPIQMIINELPIEIRN
ncbi:hypothetical protein QAD02_021492 [Eretmocerus hayati]|uniref:Uncharacterized protein n=1 Tax=Eretmocerus hayati TaxID=131215 RepID=A0ACC2PSW9_9HYME|nr:hypothetical protein QAD02_021492 [Eretmocerus hayati]